MARTRMKSRQVTHLLEETGAVIRPLYDKLAETVSVKDFGAVGDGVTDDTAAIQAAIASVQGTQPLGGGKVYFPKGVYRTSGPINTYSNVHLYGDGHTQTYIKPLDSATFAANEAVIQTTLFSATQGTNLWDYYSPYPAGLTMGVQVKDLTIDGNRASVANAGGLYVYGGKWTLYNVGVINTAAHGIWTEAGVPGSSTSGDDLHDYLNMHESYANNVYISNANQHGWFYRGPNDSSIGDIQIKTCGWAGFFQESTGTNSVGNLEVRSLHAYACSCEHDAAGAMIEFSNVNAEFVYVDASVKNGLRCYGSASILDKVLVLSNNKSNAGSFWGVIIDVASQINLIRNSETVARTSGTDGGLVQINASSSSIGQIRTTQNASTTIAQKAVEANAQCTIGMITAESYDSTGSIVLDVQANRIAADIQAKNCLNVVDYNVAGRNEINLNSESCTVDITYNVAAVDSDYITVMSTNNSRSLLNTGKLQTSALSLDITTVASTASYAPNLAEVSYIKITGLATNITFGAPANATQGDLLDFYVQQDATGGRTITWNSAYKTGYVDTGNTAYTRHHITFVYDGSFWIERSRTGWF